MMKARYADIALPVPIDHTFTYIIPPELAPSALPGVRVLVPFGKKQLSGVIIRLIDSTTVRNLKQIKDVLDSHPTLSSEMLLLSEWIAEYYLSPIGEVVKAALAPGLTIEVKQKIRLTTSDIQSALSSTEKRAPQQHKILKALSTTSSLTIPQLKKRTRIPSIYSSIHPMVQQGWIAIEPELQRPRVKTKYEKTIQITDAGRTIVQDSITSHPEIKITPKQFVLLEKLTRLTNPQHERISLRQFLRESRSSLSTIQSLSKKGLVQLESREVLRSLEAEEIDPPPSFALTSHQEKALRAITNAIAVEKYRTFLLHGVTASGKTQVYIEAIRKVLERGKTAIVLVPEISLTPQTVRRFKSHFGSSVAVTHSKMSPGERYDAWRQAHEGKICIAIGPRSAIFAPLANLGLIIVDEEHEASYKQFDSSPRYHARDIAIVRGRNAQAIVILGSATPSAESYFNAINGKYDLLELPERIDHARLPKIEIVDMIKERKRHFEEIKKRVKEEGIVFPKKLPYRSISDLLREEISERMRKNEGIILLQNRRGYSHVVECFDCGYVEKCKDCEVTLTYHSTKKHLRCHYCGFSKTPPVSCPICGGYEVRFHSLGTQQVHEELREILPQAKVLRMDLDTTTRKGSHDKILRQFEKGEVDILLGTQMVAKGLDFSRVTLVGVISADTQMLLPDFRSSERTFQLLTQVAGRSGRSQLAGEVVIQTHQLDHYSLKYVRSHDYAGFYQEELQYRKELNYPPFSRLVLIEFKGRDEGIVHHHARKFKDLLHNVGAGAHIDILGPADAAIPKIKSLYRKQIIIKNHRSIDPSGSLLRFSLSKARKAYDDSCKHKSSNVILTIDVDPQGMM